MANISPWVCEVLLLWKPRLRKAAPRPIRIMYLLSLHMGEEIQEKKRHSQQLQKFIFLNHLKPSYIVWLTINVFLTNC